MGVEANYLTGQLCPLSLVSTWEIRRPFERWTCSILCKLVVWARTTISQPIRVGLCYTTRQAWLCIMTKFSYGLIISSGCSCNNTHPTWPRHASIFSVKWPSTYSYASTSGKINWSLISIVEPAFFQSGLQIFSWLVPLKFSVLRRCYGFKVGREPSEHVT